MADTKYSNENRIALWLKKEYDPDSNSPVLTGIVNIDGQKYTIGLWLNIPEGSGEDARYLIEDIEVISEALGNSPIFRGNIKPAEEDGTGSSLARKDRTRRSRS
jgi:hypothetical protein